MNSCFIEHQNPRGSISGGGVNISGILTSDTYNNRGFFFLQGSQSFPYYMLHTLQILSGAFLHFLFYVALQTGY